MSASTRIKTPWRVINGSVTMTTDGHSNKPGELHGNIPKVTSSSCIGAGPILSAHPHISLCDEAVDIEASGLFPDQLVSLKAQVFSENGKFLFESKAQYRADVEGRIRGGSYKGIEPMGLFLFLEPVPEVANKYPRLAKMDITTPFTYTLQLIEEGEGQEKVISSTTVEKRFLADYVERIPLTTGEAEGVLFLPTQRGSSDPLPFIIDIRGLLPKLVVDRAAILASYGFAVFAFDYFLPRRMKTKDKNIYIDSQAFIDIVEFVKEHPRLDENRIGMTSSCFGGGVMLHAATRLNLPVKCMVAAGFIDILSVNVGWKNLDGSLLEPGAPLELYTRFWVDEENRPWFVFKTEKGFVKTANELLDESPHFCLEENLNCPLLLFAHKDDQHAESWEATHYLKDRIEKAGKSHLLEMEELLGTGHFLDVPYQPISTISCYVNPFDLRSRKLLFTNFGGEPKQAVKDQQFAWRKIINFFRLHLDVKEMYRTDWITT